MKYKVQITAIGDFVLDLMHNRDSIVIFNKDVPAALSNVVVSHTIAPLKEDPAVGDNVVIADREYTIRAIGEDAIRTLRENGHVTFIFGDDREIQQPGEIVLGGDKAPRIMVGDSIIIF